MSISSINSGGGNLPYIDQDKNQTENTKQSNTTATNTNSVGTTSQVNSGESGSSQANSATSTNTQSNTKANDSLTRESQFATSFQKSQLLSKVPNNSTRGTTNQPASNSTVKETGAASPSKDLGDYGHLSQGQKRLVDDLTSRQNTANKTNLSPAEFYNKLEPSQKSTFESVTNALENTNIIGKDGKKTNALDTIERVDVVLGEKKGAGGTEQFRLLVTAKDGAKGIVETAQNFHKVEGHGDKYPHSYQLNGGEPSFQISFTEDGKNADIDVDYESKNVVVNLFNGFQHLRSSNSDVRHGKHFEKHNERFASEPGQQPLVKKY